MTTFRTATAAICATTATLLRGVPFLVDPYVGDEYFGTDAVVGLYGDGLFDDVAIYDAPGCLVATDPCAVFGHSLTCVFIKLIFIGQAAA